MSADFDNFPALLVLHNWKNCFAYLIDEVQLATIIHHGNAPSNAISLGAAEICHYDDTTSTQTIFVHLFGCHKSRTHRSTTNLVIAVNGIIASKTGYVHEQQVIVHLRPNLSTCTMVQIEPTSFDDWEIIQHSAEQIEERFLDQIRVIQRDMIFPFWVGPNVCAMFRVVEIEPPSTATVVRQSTELHVSPVPSTYHGSNSTIVNDANEKIAPSTATSRLSISHLFDRLFSATSTSRTSNDISIEQSMIDMIDDDQSSTTITFRIISESLFNSTNLSRLNPSALFIHCDDVRRLRIVVLIDSSGNNHAAILINCYDRNRLSSLADCLRLRTSDHVIVSRELRIAQQLDDLVWIKCRPISKSNIIVWNKIVAQIKHGTLASVNHLCNILRAELSRRCAPYPLVLSRFGLTITVTLTDGRQIDCLLTPDALTNDNDNKIFVFIPNSDNLSIRVKEAEMIIDSTDLMTQQQVPIEKIENYATQTRIIYRHFQCQSSIVAECSKFIEYALNERCTAASSHVLIYGAESSGKSAILYRISSRLFRGKLAVYSARIDCRTMRGKKVESVEKVLNATLTYCKQRRPCLLLLDDIDQLCCLHAAVDTNPGSEIHTERLVRAIWRCIDTSEVLTIATAHSRHTVHPQLIAARGHRFFDRCYSIDALDHTDRVDVLQTMLSNVDGDFNEMKLAMTKLCSDAYVVGDLCRLSQRAMLIAAMNASTDSSTTIVVNESHLLKAIDESRPIGQQADKWTHTDGELCNWQSIGGMHSIRDLLTQVLLWPARYPLLYKSCPIRIGCGVLLYGPSGCGKTLMARVVAAEANVNLIVVKGPELLSKYIGASEQSVRDTFQRARSSKPCLVFFDEFDALAPRRGHDSTGVTDRVVNQLLTELDGIEELNGVFVLAASNRPDLIDPALLRPGRIDHLIYCAPPDTTERIEILNVLVQSVRLENGVDLQSVAQRTNGWTGADLRALITNAQFASFRRFQTNRQQSMAISTDDIDRAFVESTPKSISSNVRDRKQSMPNVADYAVGQRATLA